MGSSKDIKSSRFIIHKHIITGQWQLTEFHAYPCSRNIRAFPMTEEKEKDTLMKNRFIQQREIKENLSKAHETIKSKNLIIQSQQEQKEQNTIINSLLKKGIQKRNESLEEKEKIIHQLNLQINENQNQIEQLKLT